MGRRSLDKPCDVTNPTSLEDLLQATIQDFGSVEILVNCADRTRRMATLDVQESNWHAILDTNLNGTLHACRTLRRHIVEQRYGRIINIASIAWFVALCEVMAYCASKAAVASLTRSFAIERVSQDICLNAIAPGVFRTDLNAELLDGTKRGLEYLTRTLTRHFGRVEELAGAVVFLASKSARRLSENSDRSEGAPGRAGFFDRLRRIVGLFNEKDREIRPTRGVRSRSVYFWTAS